MHCIRWVFAGLLALGGAAAAHAQTDTSTKVAPSFTFPAKVQLSGRNLVLNGAGIRFRAVFQVYHAALYVENPSHNFADMTRNNEARRVHLMMAREINSDELGKLFARGVQDNLDKASAARLMPAMLRMSEVFTDYKRLDPGDQITLDWVPGQGTVITVRGKVAGEPFKEPEFFNALIGMWLGANPVDAKLRDALLGVKRPDITDQANR